MYLQVSETRGPSPGILSSEISPSFLSGDVTCTAIGCYKVVPLGFPFEPYRLEANNCTFLSVIYNHTVFSLYTPIMNTVTEHTMYTVISISEQATPVSSYRFSQSTHHHYTATIRSSPLPVSDNLRGDNTNELMVLFIPTLLPIAFTVFLMMICATVLLRKRRINK